MKIGIDTRALLGRSWFGPGTGGVLAPAGVAGYVFNIIDYLTRIDRQNEYLLFFNSFKQPSSEIISQILARPNVSLKTFHIPNKLFDRSARIWRWPKVDSLLGGVDVFFSPHFNITPLGGNVRHVLTIHDLSFEFYPEFYPWRKRFWHWSQDIESACRRADQVIAVSENTKRDLIQRYNLNPTKVSAVYSGSNLRVNGQVLKQQIETISNKYKLPEAYALFLGTIEPRKNVETIVESFSRLKKAHYNANGVRNLHLVIAGGKGWYYRKVLHLARQSEFKKDIHFLGYVSEQDKPAIITQAKMLLFPSYYEGFGFPPLEAIELGTPVISAANSSLSEILGRHALLIDSYNVNDLVMGMLNILSVGREQTDTIKTEAGQGEFSWEKCAAQTLDILISGDLMV